MHPASTFDDQALRYDARVGLSATVGGAVAQAIVDRAGLRADDLVVELGAGTGEIGAHLARLPIQYVGLDSSRAMLDVFRAKAVMGSSLVVADCNRPWPLPNGGASIVFASRVIHLLEPDHVVRETMRVCRRAGWLILGRVLRHDEGIKQRLRRRRQALLIERGVAVRQGEEGTRRVVEHCLAAGGESLGRAVVAEWTGETTPAEIIAGWDTLSRMGAVHIDPETRARIHDELRHWARDHIGELDRPEAFRERYAIDVVRLP